MPWDFNERASLSFLAAAAWQAGGIAVEEFSIEKKGKRRGKKHRYRGRQDLFIRIGKNPKYDFNAEAKQCWSLVEQREPCPKIEKYLRLACNDVRKDPSYGGKKLGILFAVPVFSWRKIRPKDWRIMVRRWLEKIQTIRFDCMAWFFPGVFLRDDSTAGCVVLIKLV